MINNQYFKVLTDNLSICLDSEVGYYHYFNKGDIITYYVDKEELKTYELIKSPVSKLKFDNFIIDYNDNNYFVIGEFGNNNTWSTARLMTLLFYNIVEDITKQVERDNKINNLLQ